MSTTTLDQGNDIEAIKLELSQNKRAIINRIEFLVGADHLTYLEAISLVCQERDLDPDDMAKFIQGPIKSKLEVEAMRNCGLKKKYIMNSAQLFE